MNEHFPPNGDRVRSFKVGSVEIWVVRSRKGTFLSQTFDSRAAASEALGEDDKIVDDNSGRENDETTGGFGLEADKPWVVIEFSRGKTSVYAVYDRDADEFGEEGSFDRPQSQEVAIQLNEERSRARP
ncbi:hypothetical protein [Mesorhizobium sp. B1-1-6]|uniref:hypothetical protein n=1 Tax=Mesorhizobium sp. B1-1-6 TaxID=2589978 RepID=UPI00112EE763|nr:hypothetical protein [Mesorhizobium sp. B1-1-6]TPN35266.1 hypothetical protein FJ979_20560 [Mesorhizobium sp. B1-1-6]